MAWLFPSKGPGDKKKAKPKKKINKKKGKKKPTSGK